MYMHMGAYVLQPILNMSSKFKKKKKTILVAVGQCEYILMFLKILNEGRKLLMSFIYNNNLN